MARRSHARHQRPSGRAGLEAAYSSLQVDPVDGCTFWYTQMYYQTSGAFNWQTRVGSFKYPSCTANPTGVIHGTITAAGSGTPIAGAFVKVGSTIVTTTAADGTYTVTVGPATYGITVSAYTYAATSEALFEDAGPAQEERRDLPGQGRCDLFIGVGEKDDGQPIVRKSLDIAPHRLLQRLNGGVVQDRKVSVQHDLLPADQQNPPLDGLSPID